MCFFSRPSPPPLPEPRPVAPKPEPTAERILVGTNRPSRSTDSESMDNKRESGKKRKGQRTTRARRLGTQSLRIPLSTTRNLRY